MIFRTITDESTGAIKSIGLFGKSLSELKTIIYSIKSKGMINTFFNTSTIDKSAIANYNREIKKATTSGASMVEKQQIMKTAMEGTNKATAQLIDSTNGATVSTEALTAAQHSSTLAAKAHSVALKAVSIAGNMILFAAISKGIQLATTAIDNWIHRVEKANEAMDESVGEYESAKSSLENVNSELEEQNKKLDELLSKDKLTYAEKGQLEELQAITQELLFQKDIEEKRAKNAEKEVAEKTIDAYNKQYGKYSKSEDKLKEKLLYDTFSIPANTNDVLGNIAAFIRAKDTLEQTQKDYDNALNNGEDTTWISDDFQLAIDTIDEYSQALDENISDLQEKRVALENEYNNAINKRKTGIEPLTSSEKEVIKTYESIYDMMRMVYEYTDQNTWKSMQIENIFNTEGIEKTKEELIEMVKAGEFDESTLQSYPKLSAALEQNKISASELRNELEALSETMGNVDGNDYTKKASIPTFENAWASLATTDNDSLKSLRDDLLELAEAGRLTIDTFNETEGSEDFLAQLGLNQDSISDIEDIIGRINALKSSADQLASMKKGVSALSENLYNKQQEPEKEISVDVFAGMDDGLKDQKKEWENYVTVLGSTSSSIEDVQRVTNELATAYVNSNNFLANLTETNRDYYASQLSAMGVENAEEVVTASLSAQKEILAIKEQALAITKDGVTNSTAGEIAALLNEANASDTTRAYLFQLASAEQVFNNQTLDTSGKIQALGELATAYGQTAIAAKIAAWEQAAADSHTQSSYSEADLKHLQEEMSANIGSTKIDVNAYAGSSKSGGSGSGKSGKSGASEKEETIETFDFIETAIKRIETAIERLKTRAEETFRSFTKRGREYKKAISEITKEINIQKQGYDAYIAKANSVGLEESWAVQVRDGSINIADVSDDGLKERIKNYKEWYEKALECQEKLEELKKTQKELAREKIELLITKYEKLLGKLESSSKRIQNAMDFKETWGFSASAKDYTKLNKNARSQIANIIKQNKKLKELQKTVTKGSEAWHEYNERINSNNESIQDLTKTMAENAIASASLAGQNAEAKNSAKDTADEKTDAKLSTASTSSRKNSLLANKAKNIDARQKNLQAAYNKTAQNRASYGNKILKAKKKDVSKKNKKLFTQAISKVKAGKLVSTSTINGIVNALKSAKGKEYKELSTLLSYCISYNANKNAEEENKLNLEMYALTAQEEKKSLRQEQLSNALDANQSKAERNILSNAESAAAKNHNIDAQTRLDSANANAQTQAAKNALKDRKDAAGKASFEKEKSYKKLKDKKLKKRLKKAIAAIKAGKKIDSDSLKAVKEYCQKYLKNNLTYYYNCEAYNEAVENELSAKEAETLAKAQAYASALSAKREKAANEAEGRDAENELHAATAKNQTSASAKNRYVDRQISNISQNAVTYQSAYNASVTDFNNAKNVITKSSGSAVINEIKSKFVSRNILIPADYLEKAYTVSNDFGLACSNYNEALEAMNAAKATADLYAQTAKTEKATLALEKMENIDKDYGHKISVFEQRAARIDNSMDIAQAKGYQTSKKYYERLAENEEKTNEALAWKRKDLTDSLNQSLNTGAITKFSDEWYEACGRIDDVTNAIEESAVSLAEFQKQMRQIDWDNFDYLESRIKNTISETDFLIGELSREDLASEDIGWMTDRGKAASFLHAGNYESYRKQAEDYASEIKKINNELADDPYNKELIDRKDELLQSYRECVKAAQDEKYAVIDLYEQGYEALSGKLKNLISDYEDLLDKEKDAFDYQRNIADKAKEIAGIRKQLEAYAGDMSEETRAKIQTLKASLEEAEKDLQETQYDKYISDTKEMLSDLQDNFDEAIQLIVDSLAENFGKLTEDMENTASDTCKSIMSLMTGIGYTPTEEFGKLLEGTGIAASVSAVLAELKDFHAKMTAYADKIASSANAGATADGGNAGAGANSVSGADQAIINAATQSSNGVPKGGAQKPTVVQIPGNNALIHENGKDGQNNSKADVLEETGISKRMEDFKDLTTANDYLKKHLKTTKAKRSELTDINKKFYDKHGKKILTTAQMKELAKKLGVKYDNQKSSGSLYKKLKSIGVKGFHIGSKNIPYDQLAFLGEEGDELHFKKDEGVLTTVGQGDMVFTDEMSKRLWEISQMPREFLMEKFGAPGIPPQTVTPMTLPPSIIENNQFNGGDVNITFGDISLPNVTDSPEFAKTVEKVMRNSMCKKGDTRKCVAEAVASECLGRRNGMESLWRR